MKKLTGQTVRGVFIANRFLALPKALVSAVDRVRLKSRQGF